MAFQGALARPLLATKEQLKKITPASLAEFVARNYTPDRMVLAGAGMMHSELLGVAEPLLSTLPGKSGGPEPSSTYVGGDYRFVSGLIIPAGSVCKTFNMPLDAALQAVRPFGADAHDGGL